MAEEGISMVGRFREIAGVKQGSASQEKAEGLGAECGSLGKSSPVASISEVRSKIVSRKLGWNRCEEEEKMRYN